MHGTAAPAWAHWLEGSALAVWARGEVWLYPAASVLHVLGLALLIGTILAFDLRVLGVARAVPLAAAGGLLLPLARLGFLVAVPSGLVMFAPDATHVVENPAFQAKLAMLGLALLNVLAFHRLAMPGPLDETVSRAARLSALASLLLWPAAAVAGRLIAYF